MLKQDKRYDCFLYKYDVTFFSQKSYFIVKRKENIFKSLNLQKVA